jgi:hypothetical protein
VVLADAFDGATVPTRYYGNGFRVGGNVELMSGAGSSKWTASALWVQRFKRADITAYASYVVAGQTTQPLSRLGVSLNYHF